MKTISLLLMHTMAAATVFGAGRAHLDLEVFDAFGKKLDRGIQASLYKDSARLGITGGGSPLQFTDLPYGLYRLEITCPGFRMYSKVLKIAEPGPVLKIGLMLDPVGDPAPKGLMLSGKVTQCTRLSGMWIKVLGVFTDETAQAPVAQDCSFRIDDLAGGRYLALLFEESTVRDIREIRVTLDSPPLIFAK